MSISSQTQTINIDRPPKSLWLGMTGEMGFRTVTIDVSAWTGEYPDATFSILCRRPDGSYYAPVSGVSGNEIVWTIGADETHIAGRGVVEIRLYDGDILGKSAAIETVVSRGAGTGPDGMVPDWAERIFDSEDAAAQSAVDAQTAQTAAETAQGLAENAQKAAEDAQGLAEDAQGYAEDAQAAAESAQRWARTAQGQAEDAQGKSEAAQGLAEDAQTAAETAQKNAEAWAVGQRTGVDVGSGDAAYHNNAKYYAQRAGDAQSAAEDAQSAAERAQTNAAASAAAAEQSALSMAFASFGMAASGHLVMYNPQLLGTTAFALTAAGNLEVTI